MENETLLNILLADDDLTDCQFFKDVLHEIDINTSLTAVQDGEKLMQYLEETVELPDVIFLDINMPRKNGTECLAEIKSSPKFQHIPVIIFSSFPEINTISNFKNTGAHSFIRKPNGFDDLRRVINVALLQIIKIQRQTSLRNDKVHNEVTVTENKKLS